MKVEALRAVIAAQWGIIGQLEHLVEELEKAGVFHGKEGLVTLKSATDSVIKSQKAEAFDKIVGSL